MTRLRKMMLEELERRNYSEATTRCYIRTVEDFSRRFKCSPDGLGPEHIREYQAELFKKRKLSPATVTQRLACAPLSGPLDGKVTFRWRDSAHSNEQKLLTLSVDEFLRRFLLHLLPQGFVRIRNFGFLANRRRASTLPLCFQLLDSAPLVKAEVSTAGSSDAWLCPKCGGPMLIIERLTAAELQLRSPPSRDAVAA
jgi:Phage integrase, N-terminal SAM-like domain/Putative transposase